MLQEVREIVEETAELLGVPPPEVLEDDAAVPADATIERSDGEGFYLVGLIGGKNVGKSSLVNALVGRDITAKSSYGPGTERVIAYAHESQASELRTLLDEEVPDRYEIVTHANPSLRRQVLLDLPDIDSFYDFHRGITRRMLRYMLFPVWIQSVEKYADHKPRDLLQEVAAGNDPRNFVFCLNKVDQVLDRDGEAAAGELRDEYAGRLAEALDIERPRVWMISASDPGRDELPGLRDLLTEEKSPEALARSRDLAARQRVGTLLRWVEEQKLDRRMASLDRLQEEVEELLAARIGAPLIDRLNGPLMDDPGLRLTLADEAMGKRVARWPIVNILHVLLEPLALILRYRLPLPQQRSIGSATAMIEPYLQVEGRCLSESITTVFARVRQAQPQITHLYEPAGPWEEYASQGAAEDLRQHLVEAIELRETRIRQRFERGGGVFGWLIRTLITVGAVCWFPFAQPLLEAWLKDPTGIQDLALLAVQIFSVAYLLENVTFLAIYFVIIWLCLRWGTRRRIDRLLEKMKTDQGLEPSLSLTAQVSEWMDRLIGPIRSNRQRLALLMQRIQAVRSELGSTPK